MVALYPGVKDAVVIGVKNSEGIEQVKLIVVSGDPALSTDALLNFCKRKLSAYKVPKIIEFRPSLPKSNLGKVLKRQLQLEEAQ